MNMINNIECAISSAVTAKLVRYTPIEEGYPAEIEWEFFNPKSGMKLTDLYPMFKPEVHRAVDQALWTDLKQVFHYQPWLAYTTWVR
jgi:hypothetical protein